MVIVRVCDCNVIKARFLIKVVGFMTPGQDKTTRAFFKDHWHQPVRRFGKIFMPIIFSCFISIIILFLFYYFIPLLIPQLMPILYQPSLVHPWKILSHCVLSVSIGMIVVFGGGGLYRHHQSQFRLVRLRAIKRRNI